MCGSRWIVCKNFGGAFHTKMGWISVLERELKRLLHAKIKGKMEQEFMRNVQWSVICQLKDFWTHQSMSIFKGLAGNYGMERGFGAGQQNMGHAVLQREYLSARAV